MSEPAPQTPRAQLGRAVSNIWWIPLVRGILLIVLGAYALFRPGMTAIALTQVVGFFLIAEGILAFVAAILGETSSRLWTFIRGALAILIGIFVVAHPIAVAEIAGTVLLYVLAVGFILGGLLEIVGAIQDRKHIENEGWLIIGGVLSILLGVLILFAPMAFGLTMVRILGAFAVISGISLIAFAFRVRNFGKALKQ